MDVNIEYAWAQLMRARHTAAEHSDPEVRARAAESVAKWDSVLAGMAGGAIRVGSRTPTSAPAWVTLEVATGGFATGRHSAGGALHDDERALAARLGVAPSRLALNLHYLTSDDAAGLLASARYRIGVPEHGALLVVAWLRARGELDRAEQLVRVLAPWFETLAFYPLPADRPRDDRPTVQLQSLGTTVTALDIESRQHRFETMRAALRVWKPLREQAIARFAETVDGELPRLVGGAVTGGWPGTRFPAGWHVRVAELVVGRVSAGEPDTKRASEAAQLIADLSLCARDPASLSRARYQAIRRTIARHVTAHGMPGTPEHAARRAADARAVAGPLHIDLRRVLVARLRALPGDGGVDPADAMSAVRADEAVRFGVPEGSAMPAYLEPKIARSWDAPLEALVEHGVIGSGEVLATVLPQVTAQVRAEAIDDAAARTLYAALYTAFRRRRGLLLLHYQHQVRFQELPWVAALETARASSPEAVVRAGRAAASATCITLRAFPYTIVPNKLVTELEALAGAAERRLPLVEEIAADIFMGSFTGKFVAAARVAARLIAGTPYQRYYAIDVGELARLVIPDRGSSGELGALCERRARSLGDEYRTTAWNGSVIEQAQILTTHNLAVLFDALALRDPLAPDLRRIAERCFQWVVHRLQLRAASRHSMLIQLKNAAYAWRQMIFYLGLAPDVPDFLRWARAQLGRCTPAFQLRFEPAMRGLELAAAGVDSSDPEFARRGGRVFTGWASGGHWLASGAALR
ncbi:MAG TPA: hypothetical protein VHW23_17415 [Kofleriaceae bacterium]|jgi:hypothetical protein|nr:hypothetical protein [Kofleriaceae bacterium]